jgi:hypothetical protein
MSGYSGRCGGHPAFALKTREMAELQPIAIIMGFTGLASRGVF